MTSKQINNNETGNKTAQITAKPADPVYVPTKHYLRQLELREATGHAGQVEPKKLLHKQQAEEFIRQNGIPPERLSEAAKIAIENGLLVEKEVFGKRLLGYPHGNGGGFVQLGVVAHPTATISDDSIVAGHSDIGEHTRVISSTVIRVNFAPATIVEHSLCRQPNN